MLHELGGPELPDEVEVVERDADVDELGVVARTSGCAGQEHGEDRVAAADDRGDPFALELRHEVGGLVRHGAQVELVLDRRDVPVLPALTQDALAGADALLVPGVVGCDRRGDPGLVLQRAAREFRGTPEKLLQCIVRHGLGHDRTVGGEAPLVRTAARHPLPREVRHAEADDASLVQRIAVRLGDARQVGEVAHRLHGVGVGLGLVHALTEQLVRRRAHAFVEVDADLAAVQLEVLVEVLGERAHRVLHGLRGVDEVGAGQRGQRLLETLLVQDAKRDLDGVGGDPRRRCAAVVAAECDARRRVRIAGDLISAVSARGARRDSTCPAVRAAPCGGTADGRGRARRRLRATGRTGSGSRPVARTRCHLCGLLHLRRYEERHEQQKDGERSQWPVTAE